MPLWTWITLADPELTLILWIGVSALLYVFATNLAWSLGQIDGGYLGRAVTAVRSWRFSPALLQAIRLAYHLGIPYAALIGGVSSRRLMGVEPVAWEVAGQWALILGGGGLGLLGLLWWQHANAVRFASTSLSGPREGAMGNLAWGLALLEPVYLQVHWALYRSGPILLTEDWYQGTFLGLALIALEGFSNPYLRDDLGRPGRAEGVLLTASLAVVTSLVFLATHSLWLCLATHLGIRAGIAILDRWGRPARQS